MALPTPQNLVAETVANVIERVARLYFEGKLVEKIDYIPVEMHPKTLRPTRCCIYRERAMIRYQVMAVLGFAVENEPDELRSLSSYAQEALARENPEHLRDRVLTVIDEACNHCLHQRFLVTDACQNCTARPCAQGCPKKAIDHARGRAYIDNDKCVKCGRCVQVCPYKAIIKLPIPCVEACPVGAIEPLAGGGKKFEWTKCISCGKCQVACPFGAVITRSQVLDVIKSMEKQKVVGLVAPAAAGHYGNASIWTICNALKKVGFHDVIEASIGADMTTIEEAHEFLERVEIEAKKPAPGTVSHEEEGEGHGHPKAKFMTTSCCPAYVSCVKKHVPDLEQYVSHTPAPMYFTAKVAKERYPDCKTVFIGPCIAKLMKAVTDDEYTDYALTFAETIALLRAKGIKMEEKPPGDGYSGGSMEARGFPIIGGVASAVIALAGDDSVHVKPVVIDGLNPAAVKRLKEFAKAPPQGNLLEVMACEGGCVAGPGGVVAPNVAAARVRVLLGKSQHHPLSSATGAACFPAPAGASASPLQKRKFPAVIRGDEEKK